MGPSARIMVCHEVARAWVRRRLRREEGQGLVEYALILALIAILVMVALRFLQPQISSTLNKVANSL